MIRAELLKMLVCPETRMSLALADSDLIARVNRAISLGTLSNRAGKKLDAPIGGGLVRADRALMYLIVDDIPMMLVDEAIPLDEGLLPAV